MNPYLCAVLTDIFICLAIISGVYFTKNPWCLLGLYFLVGIRAIKSNNEDEEVKEADGDEG